MENDNEQKPLGYNFVGKGIYIGSGAYFFPGEPDRMVDIHYDGPLPIHAGTFPGNTKQPESGYKEGKQTQPRLDGGRIDARYDIGKGNSPDQMPEKLREHFENQREGNINEHPVVFSSYPYPEEQRQILNEYFDNPDNLESITFISEG